MSCIITTSELHASIDTRPPLLLDCRFDLADTASGFRRYSEGHIPGALYLHLDDDCCAPLREHGGRHPLPSVEAMVALFSRVGIERDASDVVLYDDEGGCYAAHVWWMLRYLGHDRVRILDGGFGAWIEAGGAISTELPDAAPTRFQPVPREYMLVDAAYVRTRERGELLVDCRAADRFRGENESIDPVAGHIPGAINIPWRDMVDERNHWLPLARLADQLTGLDERAILYCGSGVTACAVAFAACAAGLDVPRLYAGGWSDWITWPGFENGVG